MLLRSLEEVKEFIKKRGITFFREDEFVCKHCGEVEIHSDLIESVESLRNLFGKPIVITSAYRCPEYNKQVGGVPGSAHTKGLALDISCQSSEDRYYLVDLLINALSIERIGIAKTFIHFDLDYDKPYPRIWVY